LLWVTAGRLTSPIAQATGDLSKIAGRVSHASTEVAQASQTIAGGASLQAASTEETSASLEEMAAMTRHNAENARQANRITNEARDSAARGLVAMTQMAGAIQRMKKSADESAKIVRTIDEIAFQTNLLAPAPEMPGRALRSSPTRCATSPSAAPKRRRRPPR
jgi:methyl-accepting chemotaxis protein